MARTNNLPIEDWLQSFNTQTTFIQNSHDPVMSFHDLELFLELLKFPHKIIETPGETHDYMDFDLIKSLLFG
jgi:hypothetical protein